MNNPMPTINESSSRSPRYVVRDPLAENLDAIKTRMRATWEDGDYASFASYMEPGAIDILRGWRIEPGTRLLDVGCGSGQTAIPAARAGAVVTGVDIAGNLVAFARERAAREGLSVRFEQGDAEDLPYGDGEFDVVISMIGAMFAPRPDRVASELARVLKPGGLLYMANWTPGGFAASMFKCVGKHVPPPAGVVSPALWGHEETATERLSYGFTDLELTRRYYPRWTYPFGTAELVEYFRRHFGPVRRAFAALNPEGRESLRTDLEQIYAEHNMATDGTTWIRGEFLNVSATRR
ncbi:MAG: class I SAM-dependent methyltransferase [Pseudomonadota bacterium]|nr:class I SAM-dependent methyltransferase [Pseudomonadota bacterium]